MADISKERREEMRGEVERRRGDPGYTGIFYIGDADLLALLDAADERDRLLSQAKFTWLVVGTFADTIEQRGLADLAAELREFVANRKEYLANPPPPVEMVVIYPGKDPTDAPL